MLIYIYQAALLCEDCGRATRAELKSPDDPSDESSYDSDDYPKGPFDAGESDSPQHCDSCDVFLENSLTDEGYEALWDTVGRCLTEDDDVTDCVLEWVAFYELNILDRFRELRARERKAAE
jgi:hypothetical protein